jgi:hypothetical protein
MKHQNPTLWRCYQKDAQNWKGKNEFEFMYEILCILCILIYIIYNMYIGKGVDVSYVCYIYYLYLYSISSIQMFELYKILIGTLYLIHKFKFIFSFQNVFTSKFVSPINNTP